MTRFIMLSNEWWDEQTPEQKKEYIAKHPKSKYAKLERAKNANSKQSSVPTAKTKRKKKKKSAGQNSAAAPAKNDSKPTPKPAAEEVTSDPTPEKKPELLNLSDADQDVAVETLKKEFVGSGFAKQVKAIKEAAKLPEKKEDAKVAAAAICFLAALALNAALPGVGAAINILATEAADTWFSYLTGREEDIEGKKAVDAENEAKGPIFDERNDESANNEERKHFHQQVGLDENGNFDDEEDVEHLTDQFINRKKPKAVT